MIRLISGFSSIPSTFLFILTSAAISPAVSPATSPIRNPDIQTSLPITEVYLWDAPSRSSWKMGRLTVPDLDTTIVTQSRSSLRNYDRHVARLFETTHQQCQKNPDLQGMNWQYEAANGNVSMGTFRLRCQTAREVVSGYHLIESDRQLTKTESLMNGTVQVSHVAVPKLHIVGKKADRWLDYVQTIRPVFSMAQRRLEMVQAFPDDRLQIQGSSTVPLRLPSALPKVMKVADRFVLKGDKNSYQLCPATERGECDRSRAQGFQQFTGRRGLDFYSAEQLAPGAVYRTIELARKIPGIYLENCVGQTCLSAVQWKQDGVLYEIQAQYREQPVLVKIANSAIEGKRTWASQDRLTQRL